MPSHLRCVAEVESWESFTEKFSRMLGIVECFVPGDVVRSPSVQCRIDPLQHASVVATHDQILGGTSGQVYLGCRFPADAAYCPDLHDYGTRVARVLAQEGVLARFAVDFMTVQRDGIWHTTAIEINLRKGGTTHPFLMLEFLTDGSYDTATSTFHSRHGIPCYYHATDNLQQPWYVGLTPDRLIDIAVNNDLHFDAATQEGVMFHLIGALEDHGKVGTLCVGRTRESAERVYEHTVSALDHACQPTGVVAP